MNWKLTPLIAVLSVAVMAAETNTAPVLNGSKPLTAPDIDEDTINSANTGTTIPALLATGAGGKPISDADSQKTSGGILTQLNLTNAGSGYTSAPTVTLQGGGGSGATATATLSVNGVVTDLSLGNGGSGYSSAPTVTLSGGGGSGATATASVTINGGAVTTVTVSSAGQGYAAAPAVTFTGGGSGAAAIATISQGRVTGVTITNGGSGYASAPTVTIAAATAPTQASTFDPTSIFTPGPGSPMTGSYNSTNRTLNVVTDNLPSPAPYGTFPNANNPNNVTTQNYNHTFTYRAGHNIAAVTHTATPLGTIGICANGVPLFNPSAAGGGNPPQGYNYCAVTAQLFGEDIYGGHPQMNGQYHYHSTHMLDAFDAANSVYAVNTYYSSSNFGGDRGRHADGHSKIMAYSYDGYPVYGPYGYSDPTNASAGIARMTSSWRVLSARAAGGPSAATYTLGVFIQDYEFVDGLGVLDRYNGRFAITPEYPGGTYAYFLTLDANNEPAFPYMIGLEYYGTPVAYGQQPGTPTWETGATGTASISAASGTVTGLTLTSGGSGYTSNPSVTFSGGGGSGAAATAAISSGPASVASLMITSAGSGYSTAPTVVFDNTDTNGSGAAATADVSPLVPFVPLEGIAITSFTGSGTWEFSTNSGSNWTALGAVAENSARLLASSVNTRVRFVPVASGSGSASFIYQAWDQTNGSNGELADASVNGGTTAFSTASGIAIVTVNPVADLPQFTSAPTATPNPVVLGNAIQFNASGTDADGDLLAYVWDFGDGSTSTQQNPSHLYNAAGSFNATVTISDGAHSQSATLQITVNATPSNPMTIKTMKISLDFVHTPAKNSLNFTDSFTVDKSFDPNGKAMLLRIGAITDANRLEKSFTFLSAKKAVVAGESGNTAAIKVTTARGAVTSTAALTVSLKSVPTLANTLASMGFVNATLKQPITLTVGPVTIEFTAFSLAFTGNIPVQYKAVQGKKGTASGKQ